MGSRIFLLSPASAGGLRARVLLERRSQTDLGRRLSLGEGAPLGEVYAYLSSLYFRGKLTYARGFARPLGDTPGFRIITPCLGLRRDDEAITLETLRALGEVDISRGDQRYLGPLLRDAAALADGIGPDGEVVLLGSIGTGKYVEPLLEVFGERLLFPLDFVGRGDMSRGGLLLRATRANLELPYSSLRDAVRHGPRPPRLGRPDLLNPIGQVRAATSAQAELVILVGLPASGKTTLYQQCFARTHEHVSKDAMPSARNKQARQDRLVAEALARGARVVVDNTNVTREARARLIALAQQHRARVIGLYLDDDLEACLERNRRRSGKARVPDVALRVARARLQVPSGDEGFDELIRLEGLAAGRPRLSRVFPS